MIRALASWSGFGNSIFLSNRPSDAKDNKNYCININEGIQEQLYIYSYEAWRKQKFSKQTVFYLASSRP